MNFTLEQIEQAMADQSGFCIKCGAEVYGLEPDAREVPCEVCEADKVFGAEEILIMGLVK